MSNTTKQFSDYDQSQIFRKSYNDVNGTLSVDGFLTGKVGRKVVQAITTTTILNDTEVFAFSESGTALFTLTIIYTDGSRGTLLSAERTA